MKDQNCLRKSVKKVQKDWAITVGPQFTANKLIED